MEPKVNLPFLLPCPFCGRDLNQQDPMDTIYPADRGKTIYQVVCQDCSATVLGANVEECVENWNRRATYDD